MYRVRLFVLWIAMFAVPFQGYAAAAMIFCAPGHTDVTASAEPSRSHDHAQHQHGDGHAEAKQPVKDGAGKTAGGERDAMHKCGTCGACHATALTNTLQLAVFDDLPVADLADPAIAVATRVLRVLDKPPRA